MKCQLGTCGNVFEVWSGFGSVSNITMVYGLESLWLWVRFCSKARLGFGIGADLF